jgi:5'(3')-deoxyribonucleotidase
MKIVYVDMDGVLVDFQSGIDQLSPGTAETFKGREDEVPLIFDLMSPMAGALESFLWLRQNFDTYILSTAPWHNPEAWAGKRRWVETHLGVAAEKRLILSHHKNLCKGDFLIDDRTARGADKFEGQLLRFGTSAFPNWKSVIDHLENFV